MNTGFCLWQRHMTGSPACWFPSLPISRSLRLLPRAFPASWAITYFPLVFTLLWLISPTPTALLRDSATSLEKPALIKPQNSKEGSFLSQIRHQTPEDLVHFSHVFLLKCASSRNQYRLQIRRNFIQWMFLLWAFTSCSQVSTHEWFLKAWTGSEWQSALSGFFGKSFPQLRRYTDLPSEGRRASGAWIWAASLQPNLTPGPGCEGPHLLVDPKLPLTDKPACLLPIYRPETCRVWASSSLDIKHFNVLIYVYQLILRKMKG